MGSLFLYLRKLFFIGSAVVLASIFGLFTSDFKRIFLFGSQDVLTTVSTPEVFAQGSKDLDPGSASGDPGGGDPGCGP